MGWGKFAYSEWSTVGWDREPNIKIPDCEQIPLPPSLILQGRFASWCDPILAGSVLDLRGRTLEEVKHEAGQIKLSSIFSSFQAFD